MNNRFTRLFGNDETKLRICDSIVREALPHAMLIVGPGGSGKHTLATEIAAAANCVNASIKLAGAKLPCGVCANCKRIYSGNFPDVNTLGRGSGKATIGVEELRDYREDMFLSATESRYKFYIIEDADLMTPAAQNALLKVLEEPPSAVHIILLCTESDKILSTIKSRTQYAQTELFDYEELKRRNEARGSTKSAFVSRRMTHEMAGRSNGESALFYFTNKIGEGALYLLDEPENSLSAKLQNELRQFIEDSARFYRCQFIISTHSPFLLSLRDALIYDLDSHPVRERRWTELPHVRAYYELFREHEREFE